MSWIGYMHERLPEIVSAAILGVPAAIHALIAESGVSTPEWIGSLTQVSAFGLVAWIVFYMFQKWLPAIQSEHTAQLIAQRDAHAKSMDTIAIAHKEAIKQLADTFAAALKEQRADLISLGRRAADS